MITVATTSLPAVDHPNADRWNAARSRQYCATILILYNMGLLACLGLNPLQAMTEIEMGHPGHISKIILGNFQCFNQYLSFIIFSF